MSNEMTVQEQWVAAVLEDRMATADFLYPMLPPVDISIVLDRAGSADGKVFRRASFSGELRRVK